MGQDMSWRLASPNAYKRYFYPTVYLEHSKDAKLLVLIECKSVSSSKVAIISALYLNGPKPIIDGLNELIGDFHSVGLIFGFYTSECILGSEKV